MMLIGYLSDLCEPYESTAALIQSDILVVPLSNILKPPSHSHQAFGIFNFPRAWYTVLAWRHRSSGAANLPNEPNSPRKIGTLYLIDQSFAAFRSAYIFSGFESSLYLLMLASIQDPFDVFGTSIFLSDNGNGTFLRSDMPALPTQVAPWWVNINGS